MKVKAWQAQTRWPPSILEWAAASAPYSDKNRAEARRNDPNVAKWPEFRVVEIEVEFPPRGDALSSAYDKGDRNDR